jgi:hypothetical protein
MRFAVIPIFVRGRMPGRRAIRNVPPIVGELRVEYLLDPARHRYLMFASLRNEGIGMTVELIPDLHGAQLIGMSPCAFSLAGFERVDGVEYAQSWLVSAAEPRKTSHQESPAVRLTVAGFAA